MFYFTCMYFLYPNRLPQYQKSGSFVYPLTLPPLWKNVMVTWEGEVEGNCGTLKAVGKGGSRRESRNKREEGFHSKARELWLPFKLRVLVSCLYLCLSHSASSLLLPLHLPLL